MTPAHQPRVQHAAEELLAALAGVVSAHVVTGEDGGMVEIHILATSALHPKQVVRNVESALSAGLGMEIDRRIVSVAQVRTETANGSGTNRTAEPEPGAKAEVGANAEPEAKPAVGAEPEPGAERRVGAEPTVGAEPAVERDRSPSPLAGDAGSNRLEYVRYEARRGDERCTCSVVLRSNDEEVAGTGHGPDTPAGRAGAAARAVLGAIGEARPELRLQLEAATISHSRGRSFVIVSAHRLLDRTTLPLAGAAALLRSPEEAAILAALQATNRCSG